MAHTQVFISSTYVDLKKLREDIFDFVTGMGMHPVLNEKGGIFFDWKSPLDISCYNAVAESDIYVLIIGGRYGSPSSEPRKRPRKHGIQLYNSVTRNEYSAAIKADIPIFIFVDQAVATTYDTYIKSGKNLSIPYAHVDNPQIFRLLDFVYSQRRNNFLEVYRSTEDIKDTLRRQWAGMLHDYLQKRRSFKDAHSERDVHVNAYKFFYFRRIRSLSLRALANLSGVDRDEIARLV